MINKHTWTIVVGLIVIVSVLAGAWALTASVSDRKVSVEGGAVLSESPDSIDVRCLSPVVKLSAEGFTGEVTFTNCFPTSELSGFDGSVVRNGTVLSFQTTQQHGSLSLVTPDKSTFRFAVLGDSQGHNDILQEAIDQIEGCDFVIHCGDLTPSGMPGEYAAVESVLNSSKIPVLTTDGNHDVKNDGIGQYNARFGPTQFTFEYSGVTFAFVDSSDESINTTQINWMKGAFEDASRKVIVTHVPCYDPIDGNHTLDAASSDRIEEFSLQENVDAVLSGHVHAYSDLRINNTDFVITGGAGGSLSAGSFHYVIINVTAGPFAIKKVDIVRNVTTPTYLTLSGNGRTVNLTFEELLGMTQVEGNSSYDNLYGNPGGTGNYSGVEVSQLVDLVGGMTVGQVLRVTASDGYYQTFGYGNVFPNATWSGLQGKMILALGFDGLVTPTWQDGPRLAMLPQDGLYSNSDCQLTSYPGQGYNIYASAGARWVKNVDTISIEG
jgi:predicted phosphodiesterase